MSNFVVSSLKYRPKDFESVVGQNHVTNTLKNSISENKIPSAILFCGPRGVGKTSCARIYAKEINKSSIENDENHDYSFNIFEIDAASNNKTDDIRDLIEKVRIPPQIGRYKVYIIDEVHMLSKQAENAFLKTLEEPPTHIVFILATTEKNKILPTILSRCQIYDFNRIKEDEICKALIEICKKEDFKFEEEAISIISRKSDGSLRDSLTILDRVVSYTNKNITTEKTSSLLNILDNESFLKISENIINGDLIPVLTLFNEICEKGFNEKDFLTGLASHFRNILISKSSESHIIFEFNKNMLDSFSNQGEMISNSEIIEKITAIENSIFKYNQIENKKLLVEITLMKICKNLNESKVLVEKKKDKIKIVSKSSNLVKETTVDNNINNLDSDKKQEESDLNNEISTVKNEYKETSALSLSSLKLKKSALSEKEKEKEKQEVLSNTFDNDSLNSAWKEYSSNLEKNGNNSLSSLMEMNEPYINDNNNINFKVPSKSNKKELDFEKEKIIKYLKDKLKNGNIILEIIIDKETNKEYYATPQEKFEKLSEINPLLNQFKKDLKLDL
ncbi:MAG: DNA polymerase III subunit gamma/tau [Cryomorphaceae bacterium]|nr:MAG: DNA polymerase III subunit gamma/tau [Cryomorphaceae bacterium]